MERFGLIYFGNNGQIEINCQSPRAKYYVGVGGGVSSPTINTDVTVTDDIYQNLNSTPRNIYEVSRNKLIPFDFYPNTMPYCMVIGTDFYSIPYYGYSNNLRFITTPLIWIWYTGHAGATNNFYAMFINENGGYSVRPYSNGDILDFNTLPTEISQLNITVPPTSEIYNINLMSPFGGVNIEPSATEDTYGTWPMSYGSNITLTASGKLAHLLLTPKVSTKPNVSQSVDVTVDGTTTTYPLTQNPNIGLWAGKDVKVEVSSPAPTVTVDYTSTTTPVITDTPTGG